MATPVIQPLELTRDGPETIHEQVSGRIRELVATDTWPNHFRLPAEPDLAAMFKVSRGTVRRAIQTLIDEGLLVRTRGRGTFVSSGLIEQPLAATFLSISESMEQLGIAYETEVIARELLAADARHAALLEVPEGTSLLRLARRRSVAGTFVAYFVNFVRADLCPGVEQIDFARRRLFEVIEKDYGHEIAAGRRTFEARLAAGDPARYLDVADATPVLYLEQVTYLRSGIPIEYSDVWIVGDRLRVSSILRRR